MQETEKIEIMNFDQEGYLADGKAAVEAGKKMAQIADRVADEGYDAAAMQETEKIEIMNFDQEGYLADGKAAVEAGKKMAQIADRVADEGYDAVFLMGVGGTWDELMQLEYLMNKFGDKDLAGKKMAQIADRVADEGYDAVFLMGVGGTWDELMQLEYLMNKFGDKDLEVYLIHAAEWNVMGHKRMTERSVVLTASESGTTPEVLEAVKKLKQMGIRVFAMTKPEGPIGQAVGAENCIRMASNHGAGGCEMGYYLADCFGLRLLNRRGCFPKFDLFIEQTENVWAELLDMRKRFEPKAEELARKYALAPYTLFIGSGALWGETILNSMCIHEEKQWKRTRSITSDDDFRVIVSPWILTVLATDRMARHYQTVSKHNLKYRLYYHQFDY